MFRQRPLAEVATYISRGVSPKYDKTGFVVLNQRCVRDHRIQFENSRITNSEKTRIRPEKFVQLWDVVVNSTGVGTLGRVAQIKRNIDHVTVDSHVTIVRPALQLVDGRYFGYALIYREPHIEALGEGATGQTELSRQRLSSVEIPLPPRPIQQKIAAILSAYDDLIENNLRRVRILEEMVQTLYREWFVKFRFPGHETVRMVDSPLGEIPERWAAVALKEMVKSVKDNVKAGRHLHQIPYLPIGCLPRKSLAIVESKPGKEAKSSLIAFKRRDIIFGAMRPYFHKVVIAPFAGTTRSTCLVLRAVEEHSYSWAVLTLFEDNTVEYANKHSRGATIPYAVWDGSLSEMPCVRPPGELMEKFNEIVSPTLESIRLSYFRQLNLRRTRDLLLSRLISGDLDVSDLDIDIREGTT